MSFVKFLQGIGDRLGILETVKESGSVGVTHIQTRSVSLRDLMSEINAGAVQSLADSPADLTVSVEKIYETAGISANPQDWTVDRVKQALSSEDLKNKPREEIQKSLLDRLYSEGVAVDTILKDAMARDKALDSFEAFVREKMGTRTEACKKRILEVESRIKSLQKEGAALKEALKSDEDRWSTWKKLKREKERELASIVGYIVDHRVITMEDEEKDT